MTAGINSTLKTLAATALMLVTACAAAAEKTPAAPTAQTAEIAPLAERLPEDEIIYFVLPDRFENADPTNDAGGLPGGRLDHGFDPTNNGFFHGGDIAGLTSQLDYLQALGISAIWLSPIFENKPVQGAPGLESAGYHGYWITDFLNVDPHFGTRDEFRAFVNAAHARGMKVYMDIITNHSADVIQYEECHGPNASDEWRDSNACPYRSKGEYPYTLSRGVSGSPINDGFLGDDPAHQTAENFARLTDHTYAYTPFVPATEADIKNPAWLNDIGVYHNRGDTRWEGENSTLGDFAGLDDLMTTNPAVVQGFIDIYSQWITDFRVDGFRIDTAKHVNPEFWQAFIPAIEAHAAAEGIENFHIFGEVYEFDPGQLAKFTVVDRLPTVLDFAFQGVARAVVADGEPARGFERLFNVDAVYAGGTQTARRLPTFLGNHDMGRFSGFVRDAHPDSSDSEKLARTELAHAIMLLARGVPTIYYGDEQGFVSDGGDRGARENMFASQVPDYNDNTLIGTDATTADRNFDTGHPLFTAIANLARLRHEHVALRRGEQLIRHTDLEGGLLAFSRFASPGADAKSGTEYIAVFNADETDREIDLPVDGRSNQWQALYGTCAAASSAPGSYGVRVPALGYILCRSEWED
ncbi:MAG: alpha-amylase family glycosyl hydrolase [Pseudomonadota bacterium]